MTDAAAQTPPASAPGPLRGLLARHPFWITFLACLPILILRDPGAMLAPPVMVEDGTGMLAFYFRDPDPARILRYYGGYISLGPNLVGYLASLLPLRLTPYVLHWVPVVLAAATFAAIQIRGVALLGLGTGEKFLLALGLCLMPLGNWALITNTTYMLWNLLILSTILVLFWRPEPGPGASALMALLLVASWSHPLFIVLAPALMVRIWMGPDRFTRVWFAAILVSVLAYMALGLDLGGLPDETGDDGGLIAMVRDSIGLLLSRGVFEPVFSSRLRTALVGHGLLAVAVAGGALLLLGLAGLLWRWRQRLGRAEWVQILALVALAGLYTAASVASGKAPFASAFGHRYTLPAGMLLALVGGWALLTAARGRPRRQLALGGAAVALWLVALNALDLGTYRTAPADGAAMAALIDTAARQTGDGPWCVRLDRGVWSVVLDADWPADRACPPPD